MQKHVLINGNKIAEEDLRYFVEKPSSGFSPEKNRATIQRTIKKYLAYRAQKQKEYEAQLGERIDATSSYINYLNRGDMTAEKYFGKQVLAKLQGRRILSTLFKAANGQTGAKLGYADEPIIS